MEDKNKNISLDEQNPAAGEENPEAPDIPETETPAEGTAAEDRETVKEEKSIENTDPSTDFDTSSVGKHHDRRRAMIFSCALLLMLLVAALALLISLDVINPFSKSAKTVPYEIHDAAVYDIKSRSGDPAVLTEKALVIFDSKGKTLAEHTHTYSKPIMSVYDNEILVCDRTTGRYFICRGDTLIHSEDLKAPIYSCAIGKNGTYALSVESEDHASELRVYGNSQKFLFSFKCASEYITSVCISSDGRSVAALSLGSDGASVYSKLYVLSLKTNGVIFEKRYDGRTAVKVTNAAGNFLICDSEKFTLISKTGKEKDIKPDKGSIVCFSGSPAGSFASAISLYGSVKSAGVTLYSNSGDELFNAEIPTDARFLDYDGGYICVLGGDQVLYSFNSSGKPVGKCRLDTEAQRINVCGRYCYAICFGKIVKIDILDTEE